MTWGGQEMPDLQQRIRHARVNSRISQATLANKVGVQRSAVAQWERKDGSHPSMEHLTAIAVVTGVHLEWLGTGRGPARPGQDAWSQTLCAEDYIQDHLEAECIAALRKLPVALRKQMASILSLLSKNF